MRFNNCVYPTLNDAFCGLFMDTKLSQRKFAARIGVSVSMVNCVLHGKRNATWDLIKRVEKAFDFEVEVLVEVVSLNS